MPALGKPWTTAGEDDVALVDRMDVAWTGHDVEAVSELYTPDATLWLSIAAQPMDFEAIRHNVEITPNAYQRVSAVSEITATVPGLAPLAAADRYLHFAAVIHGDLFDCVLEVTPTGMISRQYLDYYAPADVRLHDGFPAFGEPGA